MAKLDGWSAALVFPGKSINLKCRQETGDGVEWVAVESKLGRSVVGIGM